MTLTASTLRPGLLVSLKTSIAGNVRYAKRDIETDHKTAEGEMKAKWETERTVVDPQEHEAAMKARSKVRSLVGGVCAASAFGMLCPEADVEQLNDAVAKAREIADEFNANAKLTRLGVYCIIGRIAPDDVEAVRAINNEVSDLMQLMKDGISQLDAKAVRDAATRAKSIGMMLTTDAQARIQVAVEAARGVAKAIVKAGETAAVEIDKRAVRQITEARTSFLDLDEVAKVAAPKATAAAIDLVPQSKATSPTKAKAATLEID